MDISSSGKGASAYLSPASPTLRTPPHSGRDVVTERMSSSERKQYNKALKAMYEIVRLSSKQLEQSVSDGEVVPETETLSETSATERDEIDDDESHHSNNRNTPHLSTGRKSRTRLHEKEVQHHLKAENVKRIHEELIQISKMLQKENVALHEREVELRERESALRDAEKLSHTTDIIIDRLVSEEVERHCQEVAENWECKFAELEDAVQKKTRELKRMRESFDTIKTANDSLKKQISDLEHQNKRLETQAMSVQHRLTNLQRKNEILQRGSRPEDEVFQQSDKERSVKLPAHSKDGETTKSVSFTLNKVNFSGFFEVLAVLLEWISESHLQKTPSFQTSPRGKLQEQQLDFPSALVHEKCLKILPGVADILSFLPGINPQVQLPCLQFTYWSVVFMEQTVQGSQRTALASTLRHIGEELYKPQVIKVSEEGVISASNKGDRQRGDIYFHSPNIAVRLLSSLIILKTLSRVDYLAHVFDVLKTDLKDDVGKQMFLTYEGVNVALSYMKPVQKALLGSAVDVMLLMSVDSPFTHPFLDSCSNEPWFRTAVSLLQHKGLDPKILEKLSIVLQRLSKIKSNRRYFDAFQISAILQEMLRTCDPDHAFLALNLRSIIFNLGQGNK